MNIATKLLHPDARLPTRGTEASSGLDLYALDGVSIENGQTKVVRFGVAVSIPRGFEGQIRGRSSLSRQGLLCHLGTVDQDYRGEIMATLTNTHEWGAPFRINAGERVAQLVIAPVVIATCIEFAELDATERGEGGWGSTGK